MIKKKIICLSLLLLLCLTGCATAGGSSAEKGESEYTIASMELDEKTKEALGYFFAPESYSLTRYNAPADVKSVKIVQSTYLHGELLSEKSVVAADLAGHELNFNGVIAINETNDIYTATLSSDNFFNTASGEELFKGRDEMLMLNGYSQRSGVILSEEKIKKSEPYQLFVAVFHDGKEAFNLEKGADKEVIENAYLVDVISAIFE